MSSVTAPRPPVRGFHHVSLTVTDLETSVEWYQRLLELQRLSSTFPDYGSEENDYAIVLIDADAGISIGRHHHDAIDGRPFDERQTGLDHIAMAVPDRADLDVWAALGASLPRPGQHRTGVLPPPDLTGHGTSRHSRRT